MKSRKSASLIAPPDAGRLLVASGSKDDGKKLLERLTKEKDFEGSPLKAKAEELLGTLQ